MIRDAALALRSIFQGALCAALPMAPAAGAAFKTLYTFTGGADGGEPYAGLTPDGAGNVYGTTIEGGSFDCGCGTVFKFSRAGALTTLHSFEVGPDGRSPSTGVSLIGGSLYGGAVATTAGHCGMLFSLNPDGSAYRVLHEFNGQDGGYLRGVMQAADAGGAFGVAQNCGEGTPATLFYVSPNGQFAVAHRFTGGANDGTKPNELVEDAQGNLFGSTSAGGGCATRNGGCGVIFEYSQRSRSYSVIYKFQGGDDGYWPVLGAAGPDGTVYGVTNYGGSNHHGVLFSLSPSAQGYQFSVLAPIQSVFAQDIPANPPALAPDGSLIGATVYDGTYDFANGAYSITYRLPADPLGPYLVPAADPIVILGTSVSGGSGSCIYGCGFIFRASP